MDVLAAVSVNPGQNLVDKPQTVFIYRRWPDGRWIYEHGPLWLGTALAEIDKWRQIQPACEFVIAGTAPPSGFSGHSGMPHEIEGVGWYYPAWETTA